VFDGMTIQTYVEPYEVHFDDDVFTTLDQMADGSAHFIVDEKVADLYREKLAKVLSSSSVLTIQALESNKSLEALPAYVNHLTENGIRRDQKLVAIGGGIIQDITCFLAATVLRGVDWHFYPTTLLAQADSCIGSKSSINCGSDKNILGTFTPPKRVNIYTGFLSTLDGKDVKSGVGEMIKVHIIDGDAAAAAIAADYDQLFTDSNVMKHYIRRSLEIKKSYIEADEFDRGLRNIFNYGHSFGHAIETATQFGVPHGIAVTIGMDMANYVAWRMGVGSEENYRQHNSLLRRNYGDYASQNIPLESVLSAISKDKKNTGTGSVTLILPDTDGKVFKETYANDEKFKRICGEFLGILNKPVRPFEVVIFDLDGTLIDSAPDVCAHMNAVLVAGGRRELSLGDVKRAIGAGGRGLVEKTMAMAGEPGTEQEIDQHLDEFFNSYVDNPVEFTMIFPGVLEVLERFHADGITMGICTNKPTATTMPVIAALGLEKYFSVISCGDTATHQKPDRRHILDVVEELNASPETAVMIGDSENDITAAISAGVKSVAVTFGYAHAPHGELGADAVIDHFEDLPEALRQISG
jgi:3-dehydroquinate synthase